MTSSSMYGKKLKEMRISEGLTQKQLSEKTGISLGSIKNYESGHSEVGLSVIERVLVIPEFKKYALWLMTDEVNEDTGQSSPELLAQESIGKKIREIRESEGLTRKEFFELTGIAESSQKLYETGKRENIGIDTVTKITQHERFKKYTLWLMTGECNEDSGQVSPALSPDMRNSTLHHQDEKKVG